MRRTPRKARLVADAVRGMGVAEALAYLEFSPRLAAVDVAKVIRSAAANAEHNFNLSRDDLYLKNILVDEGPTLKRIHEVSRGMAHMYFHRLCHITAIVEEREQAETRRRARRARPAGVRAEPQAGPGQAEEQEEQQARKEEGEHQ